MILRYVFSLLSGQLSLIEFILYLTFSVAALLMVFPIHECAHGLTALAFGDPTAKYQGRLTLNPLAHIDKYGFLALLLLGFGWAKPVQYDPVYFPASRRRLAIIFTALAGPLSNFLFGVITCFLTCLLQMSANPVVQILSMLFYIATVYNFGFAFFNLIPLPPLDGSKIVGELLPTEARFKYYGLERYSMLIFIGLVLLLRVFDPISALTGLAMNGFGGLFTFLLRGGAL